MHKPRNRKKIKTALNSSKQNLPVESEKRTSIKTQEQTPNIKSRLFLVWGGLIAASMGLSFNLYKLQIVRGPELLEKARSQQMVNLRPYMPRRPIVDRNNNVLAIDLPVYNLYARPKLFVKSKHDIAELLAPILNKDTAELENSLEKKDSNILLASALPEQVADQIFSLHLNGLEQIQKYSRFYPQQKLVAEVVGFVNVDRLGQGGVERSQQNLLERSVKNVHLIKAANGTLLPDYTPEGFVHFDDLRLQLTIDSRLQRIARLALKQQIDKFHAQRGAVIVMDAWDGSLLALTCEPTYNPNEYSKADISLFKNWTVTDLYEPGSTFKPLNVALALDAGAIKPDDVFNDPGSIRVADRTITNAEHGHYGRINITQILQHSSNIGMVQIIQRLRPSVYYGALERLGLGQTIDTDLPFAVASQIKRQEEFINTPIEPATASFGQGFSLTPLELVQMLGALANGGKLVTPHVVRGLVDTKGQLSYSPTLPAARPIFSASISQKVIEMMQTVVDEGTGKESQIPGYHIAGKTGTAQKASKSGGYSNNVIASFVGILPVEAPRYVVLALVDDPKGKEAYGGTVAAPIAKSILEALISTQQIPPSRLMSSK